MKTNSFPPLLGPLTPSAITSWLNRCEDTVTAHVALNPGSTIAPSTMILLAGLRMEEPETQNWWSDNRDALKALSTWEEFSVRVRDRFIPSNWRLAALAVYYNTKQGNSDFRTFAAALEKARNALNSAGKGYAIHDITFRNHLLFFSHPVLQLRVRANQSIDFATIKTDSLNALMTATWDSLVEERIVSPGTTASPRTTVPSPAVLPELTHDEKQRLRAAKGCFNCRRSPGDADWKPHPDLNCPGDASRGIPARTRRMPAATAPAVTRAPLEHTVASIRFADTNVPITFDDVDDLPGASAMTRVASVVPLSSPDDDWCSSDEENEDNKFFGA